MSASALRKALNAGALRELDVYFAERITRHLNQNRDNVALAAAMVSQAVGEGHVCVDMLQQADKLILGNDSFTGIQAPVPGVWEQQLQDSGVVGTAGEIKPLVLDDHRLYLGRYWQFEQELAECLIAMAQRPAQSVDHEILRRGLERLFPTTDEMDWQQLAAAMAVIQSLIIISGGPGTGKTHTVTAILALLIEQAQAKQQKLRIAMAAPTGKAAVRLAESVRNARFDLKVADSVKQEVPVEALTLHRLLGVRPDQVIPWHNRQNPLHLDVLVVDEASMIDLPLMNRLLAALPQGARLIVLGDKDQLSSVEAGSVFADLCGGEPEPAYSADFSRRLQLLKDWPFSSSADGVSALTDNTALLRKSYRFGRHSGIGHLARAVNAGDLKSVHRVLSADYSDIVWRTPSVDALSAELGAYAVLAFAPIMAAETAEQALDELEKFRILCAVRRGPTGVERVNQLVQKALTDAAYIHATAGFYAGRPVMVTRNDYSLGLSNGDIGILWPDATENGVLRVWFRLPDNSIRSLMPGRLPAHETAFALTVHKSQGSEFARVLLLLPESDSPVLSRELIYTGISRAAETVEIWGGRTILEAAVRRRVARTSGLLGRLL